MERRNEFSKGQINLHEDNDRDAGCSEVPEVQAAVDLRDGGRIAVALGNTAHVDTALDLEEALVTPAGAPRVLNIPEVKTGVCISSVTNGEHGVVDVTRSVLAAGRSVDTTGIRGEVIDDLEGDGNRLLVDGGFELSLITSSDVDGAADLEFESGRVNRAILIHSFVRICSLRGHAACVVCVLEGVRGKAAVAAVVVESLGTVDELLLSVGLQDTVLDKMRALKATDRGECPA